MKEKMTTTLNSSTRKKLRKIAADNGLKYENEAIELLVREWYKEGDSEDGMDDSK